MVLQIKEELNVETTTKKKNFALALIYNWIQIQHKHNYLNTTYVSSLPHSLTKMIYSGFPRPGYLKKGNISLLHIQIIKIYMNNNNTVSEQLESKGKK